MSTKIKKRILISPIGDTDPIRNYRDGAMIHTARKYLPEKIYLLMTEDMLQNHIKDNRYVKSICSLYEAKKTPAPEIIIKELKDKSPHDFEIIEDIVKILDEIINENKNEDAELLANLSSGTPQIKSGLASAIIFNNLTLKTIQISTPQRGSNKEVPHCEEWDVKNGSLDSIKEYYVDRTSEIKLFEIRRQACYQKLKALNEEYDYITGFDTLENEQFEKREELIELFNIGKKYSSFDTNKELFKKIQKNLGIKLSIDENKNSKTNATKLINAYNIFATKYFTKKYNDFVLGMTPLFFFCCRKIIENVLFLDKIIIEEKYKATKINYEKLEKYKLTEIGGLKLGSGYGDRFLDSKFLISLYENLDQICEICPDLINGDAIDNEKKSYYEICEKLRKIRKVETNIRHKAAHETFMIKKEDFKEYKPKDVLKDMKALIKHAYRFEFEILDSEFEVFNILKKAINEKLSIK